MNERTIRESLPAKLKEMRNAAGMTVQEVGERIGKSLKTVSGWEHGRGQPDADMLLMLCELYGVKDINRFFSDSGESFQSRFDLTEAESELVTIYNALNNKGKETLIVTARSLYANPDTIEKDTQKEAT